MKNIKYHIQCGRYKYTVIRRDRTTAISGDGNQIKQHNTDENQSGNPPFDLSKIKTSFLHNVGVKSSLLVGRDNKQGRAAIENKFPYAFLLFLDWIACLHGYKNRKSLVRHQKVGMNSGFIGME